MNLLIVIVPEALIAGSVTVTAVYYCQCSPKYLLKCYPILFNHSTDMPSSSGYSVIKNNSVEHHSTDLCTEKASLNVRALDPHFAGEAL